MHSGKVQMPRVVSGSDRSCDLTRATSLLAWTSPEVVSPHVLTPCLAPLFGCPRRSPVLMISLQLLRRSLDEARCQLAAIRHRQLMAESCRRNHHL